MDCNILASPFSPPHRTTLCMQRPNKTRFARQAYIRHAQRRYQRNVLRRLAFIRAARNVGLTLDEVRAELEQLPESRTPTRSDWGRISKDWRQRLSDQIVALTALRDGLESCIGCGCLSLKACAMSNPGDVAATFATEGGAAFLPTLLRRPPTNGR